MKTLRVENRQQWRWWLEKNGKSSGEIWLIYYKKSSGKARIPYNDAVEEALCFGWIDSTVRKLDKDRYVQKFTPRRKSSRWSAPNVKRARKLIRKGRMTAAGLAVFDPPGKWRYVPPICQASSKQSFSSAGLRGRIFSAFRRSIAA